MAKKFTPQDLPQTIPVFPLPGALLLPNARLPLNIFEPRYLTMVEDVLKTPDRLIGMVQPLAAPDGDTNSLHQIGCAGRIISFVETDDNRNQILLQGVSRFRIGETHNSFAPYVKADVSWDSFSSDLERLGPDHGFDRPHFLNLIERFFKARDLSSDMETLREADEELLINSLAMMCPFSIEEKQALLEAPDLENRRETLVMILEFALHEQENRPMQ